MAAVAALGGAMLGFVLRDAYRRGISISVKQVAVDLVFGASGLLASQAIVALVLPGQLLPLSAYAVCAGGVRRDFPASAPEPESWRHPSPGNDARARNP